MGIENVLDSDGIGLAIVGMIVVFAGLIFISLYIASIPALVDLLVRMRERRGETTPAAEKPCPEDAALRAAVGAVIQIEMDGADSLDRQRITIQRDASQHVWALAGKMRTLSTRR